MTPSTDYAGHSTLAKRKLVVVLGPHRSGTSLCTAAIESLGAHLGISSLYQNEENLKGFFESPELVDLNERLLFHLGGVWDNPSFIGREVLARTDIGNFEKEARSWILALFRDSSFVAIKDPRLCQLLPFWLKVFEGAGFKKEEVYLIQVVRDPVEVAISQSVRASKNKAFYEFGLEVEEGAALWLSLTVQSIASSEGYQNLFVSYEKILKQPRFQLKRIANFLGVSDEVKAVDEFVENFVDQSLHRNKPYKDALVLISNALPVLDEVYSSLEEACDRDGVECLPSVLDIFQRDSVQIQFYRAQFSALSRLSRRCRELGMDELKMKDEIQHLHNEVTNLREVLDKRQPLARRVLSRVKSGELFRTVRLTPCLESVEPAGAEKTQHLKNQVDNLREELDKQVFLYRRELETQIANYKAALEDVRSELKQREQSELALKKELDRALCSAPPGQVDDNDDQEGGQ